MPPSGLPSHLDLCVSDPLRSIRFYDTLLGTLGFRRLEGTGPEWRGPSATRAAWSVEIAPGAWFGIDLRPAAVGTGDGYEDNSPGPHHFAIHAESRAQVERAHENLQRIEAEVVDAPAEYGGQPGYGEVYYALFVRDPDGLRLEVVYAPGFEG